MGSSTLATKISWAKKGGEDAPKNKRPPQRGDFRSVKKSGDFLVPKTKPKNKNQTGDFLGGGNKATGLSQNPSGKNVDGKLQAGRVVVFEEKESKNVVCEEICPSSHNHGSVKNGCISNSSYLSNTAIFHLHDYGRKIISIGATARFLNHQPTVADLIHSTSGMPCQQRSHPPTLRLQHHALESSHLSLGSQSLHSSAWIFFFVFRGYNPYF